MNYTFKKWTPVLGDKTWVAPSADVVGNDTSRFKKMNNFIFAVSKLDK